MMVNTPMSPYVGSEQYICPFCNMGSGHTTRVYTRSSNDSPEARDGSNRAPSSATRPRTYDRTFQTPIAFDRHILERHGKFFKRLNADEFYCGFCPCGTVASQPTCSATFFQVEHFLQHLRSWHTRCPESLFHFNHLCAPISVQSYPSAVREAAERRF